MIIWRGNLSVPLNGRERFASVQRKFSRVLILLLIAGLVGAFFAFDLQQYLTLSYLKSRARAKRKLNLWMTIWCRNSCRAGIRNFGREG
jgi:hypothetical protein